MKVSIHKFKFIYPDPNDFEIYEFNNPDEAIKFFNNKGFGMDNWQIKILLDFGIESRISLETFNDITDYWEED